MRAWAFVLSFVTSDDVTVLPAVASQLSLHICICFFFQQKDEEGERERML